jgi:hypothetical protein
VTLMSPQRYWRSSFPPPNADHKIVKIMELELAPESRGAGIHDHCELWVDTETYVMWRKLESIDGLRWEVCILNVA